MKEAENDQAACIRDVCWRLKGGIVESVNGKGCEIFEEAGRMMW